MKKFFKKLLYLTVHLLIALLVIDYVLVNPINDPIVNYQLEKIKNKLYVNSVFIGDSSCGNSINVNIINLPIENFSLTGDYNLINSLRLLKKIYKNHPELKNVYFMNTFDVFLRTNSLILNLNLEDENIINRIHSKVLSIKYLLTIRPFYNPVIDEETDYMRQNEKVKNFSKNLVLNDKISSDNKDAIILIKEFCLKNKINYEFMFGPSVTIKKNDNYWSIINFFNENKINYFDKYYVLNDTNIGDAIDHVHPDFKNKSTLFYSNILLIKLISEYLYIDKF